MPLNALRNGALSVVVRCPARCGQVMTVLEERVNEVGNLRVRCGGAGTVCRARTLARPFIEQLPKTPAEQRSGAVCGPRKPFLVHKQRCLWTKKAFPCGCIISLVPLLPPSKR